MKALNKIKNNYLVLLVLYFTATFTVLRVFYLYVFPTFLGYHSLTMKDLVEVSGIFTVLLVYGDMRYNEGRMEAKDEQEG